VAVRGPAARSRGACRTVIRPRPSGLRPRRRRRLSDGPRSRAWLPAVSARAGRAEPLNRRWDLEAGRARPASADRGDRAWRALGTAHPRASAMREATGRTAGNSFRPSLRPSGESVGPARTPPLGRATSALSPSRAESARGSRLAKRPPPLRRGLAFRRGASRRIPDAGRLRAFPSASDRFNRPKPSPVVPGAPRECARGEGARCPRAEVPPKAPRVRRAAGSGSGPSRRRPPLRSRGGRRATRFRAARSARPRRRGRACRRPRFRCRDRRAC
jgi:hypothetical protein